MHVNSGAYMYVTVTRRLRLADVHIQPAVYRLCNTGIHVSTHNNARFVPQMK